MSSVLLSCIGRTAGHISSGADPYASCQLDSSFSSLLDILPPECYFDANTMLQLKSTKSVLDSTKPHNKNRNASSTTSVPVVTKYAQLLEMGEEQQKVHSNVKTKLHNRIVQMEAKRKGSREKADDKKGSRRDKAANTSKEKQSKKNKSIPKGAHNVKVSQNGDSGQSSGNFLFSRFAFMNDKKQKDQKKVSNEKLLALAEKREEKVKALRMKDSESARQVEGKEAWQKALDKARGVKVKDDPKFLRKAIRKEHSLKRRSARHWAERSQQETAKQAERQKKRQHNIDKAKAVRVKSKMKRSIAKGHVIPGF